MLAMSKPKQQFNVYLEPELIAAIKHHAIDAQLSLSDLVAHILTAHLKGIEDAQRSTFPAPLEAAADDPR